MKKENAKTVGKCASSQDHVCKQAIEVKMPADAAPVAAEPPNKMSMTHVLQCLHGKEIYFSQDNKNHKPTSAGMGSLPAIKNKSTSSERAGAQCPSGRLV
jgi:hypothetical protein